MIRRLLSITAIAALAACGSTSDPSQSALDLVDGQTEREHEWLETATRKALIQFSQSDLDATDLEPIQDFGLVCRGDDSADRILVAVGLDPNRALGADPVYDDNIGVVSYVVDLYMINHCPNRR